MKEETRVCQNCKASFAIDASDFAFYEKMQVPPPTWCSECRLIRRLAWRNERTFYQRNCDNCRKSIISIHAPEAGFTVYCPLCWWSDDWDAMEYGIDFDPSKPFIAQVRGLFQKIPLPSTHGLYTSLVNSDYTHMVSYLKNCYMVTYSDEGENLIYGSFVNKSKDSVDNLIGSNLELCYENVNCMHCFQVFYSVDCNESRNVYGSKNCTGCSDCFGCVNLRNKQYHIFNKPVSKEEFGAFVKEVFASRASTEQYRQKAEEFWVGFPHKFMHGWHNVGAMGDYIWESKNIRESFFMEGAEDCRFSSMVDSVGGKLTDSYDFTNYGVASSLLYEVLQAGDQISNVRFSWWVVTNVMDVEYGMFIVNSQNIFGSVGLKKRQYCILNKQYSKEEFEKLRAIIMRQMDEMPYIDARGRIYKYGEFFPMELSPFLYNETSAQDFFPITKDEASAKGYGWREIRRREYEPTILGETLPQTIHEVADSILDGVIACLHKSTCGHNCTAAFKIIPQELAFYRRMNLPVPQLCPSCRHGERTRFRNPMKLWHRRCGCAGKTFESGIYQNFSEHFHGKDPCTNEFETSYAPNRPEIIYCEQCYQAEVV